MLPIILCLFEGLNDLRLVYNDCEKIYFITFVKVGVAIYNDHTVLLFPVDKVCTAEPWFLRFSAALVFEGMPSFRASGRLSAIVGPTYQLAQPVIGLFHVVKHSGPSHGQD